MIKGVNKKIIEVNNPDSQYFDKVILYIKPSAEIQSRNEIAYEVDRYLKSLIKHRGNTKKKRPTNVDINNTMCFVVIFAIVLLIIITLILC
jgi:hypothetical protein